MSELEHRCLDAFCLMTYVSRDGRVSESIWNSRDGVVPQVVTSRDGGCELFRLYWGLDRQVPGHVPGVGDRVFVDVDWSGRLGLVEAELRSGWLRLRRHFGTRAGARAALIEEAWVAHRLGEACLVEVSPELARERGWSA